MSENNIINMGDARTYLVSRIGRGGVNDSGETDRSAASAQQSQDGEVRLSVEASLLASTAIDNAEGDLQAALDHLAEAAEYCRLRLLDEQDQAIKDLATSILEFRPLTEWEMAILERHGACGDDPEPPEAA